MSRHVLSLRAIHICVYLWAVCHDTSQDNGKIICNRCWIAAAKIRFDISVFLWKLLAQFIFSAPFQLIPCKLGRCELGSLYQSWGQTAFVHIYVDLEWCLWKEGAGFCLRRSSPFAGTTHVGVGFFSRAQHCCSTGSDTAALWDGSYSFAKK